MKKRVFRNKIVYWISIIYFITILFSIFKYLTHFFSIIDKEHIRYYINVFNFIIIIVILIFLIDKNSKSVFLINFLIGFIVFLAVFRIFNAYFYLGFFQKQTKGELFSIFLNLLYLFLVNFFKVNQKDILKSEEIDQIGNENIES
jgi:TRAP-type uncharacterized transport system fused permease subunit